MPGGPQPPFPYQELEVLLTITFIVPPLKFGFSLSWGSCLPSSPNSRWGKVLATARSSTEPPTPPPSARPAPLGRSAPAACGSGMGCAGTYLKGTLDPGRAASSRSWPPRAIQRCAAGESRAAASLSCRRVSQARPWAAQAEQVPRTAPPQAEPRRAGQAGHGGAARSLERRHAGLSRRRAAEFLPYSWRARSECPSAFPGVPDSGKGTPKWPSPTGLLSSP